MPSREPGPMQGTYLEQPEEEEAERQSLLAQIATAKREREEAERERPLDEDWANNAITNLWETQPPTLSRLTVALFHRWRDDIENRFCIFKAHEHVDESRTRWAIGGLTGGARVRWAERMRDSKDQREPSTWKELQETVRDTISEPNLSILRSAMAFYRCEPQPNQSVSQRFAWMAGLEDELSTGPLPEPHRWQFYYTRLPSYIRNALVERQKLAHIQNVGTLREEAIIIESVQAPKRQHSPQPTQYSYKRVKRRRYRR